MVIVSAIGWKVKQKGRRNDVSTVFLLRPSAG